MPTNKELTDNILSIDPQAQVDGLKNAELSDLLKSLRAKQYAESKQPEIQKSAEVAAGLIDVLTQGQGLQLSAPQDQLTPEAKVSEQPTPEAPSTESPTPEAPSTESPTPEAPSTEQTKHWPHVYRVVAGKAITSKRGVLGPGDEVHAEYFANGTDTLKTLIDSGMVE